ncbi:hypothetical protein HK101_011078 [Irineochytrium annulatum]|nr:hypothetical protein HK101_011078 [Irineochytrium annulatum]
MEIAAAENVLAEPVKKTHAVTVFTGFLGAGKTTIILSLIQRLPRGYNVVLLKNEFGDVKVDSELAAEENIKVTEMLNGCMCCVLVGQMKVALMEIKEKFNPDRIIIETSGSAFPAPIAWQIRQIADEGFVLDGIITVIDCVNFTGYEDTSYTAKMQAKYTDVILLNKHELVTERELETVMDHVYELNEDTPKIKCEGEHGVSPDLLFGLDTRLFELDVNGGPIGGDGEGAPVPGSRQLEHHNREVDLIQLCDPPLDSACDRGEGCDHAGHQTANPYHKSDVAITVKASVTEDSIRAFLGTLSKENIYRVKGFVKLADGLYLINWAFERFTLTKMKREGETSAFNVRITVMGVELRRLLQQFADGFGVATSAAPLTFVKFGSSISPQSQQHHASTMAFVKEITNEAQFHEILQSAPPTKAIAPIYAELASRFRHVICLKVDVDKVKSVAEQYGISAMPTFKFVKNKAEVFEMRGASPKQLEEMITKYQGPNDANTNSLLGLHVDLDGYLTKNQVECLNQSEKHTVHSIFSKDGSYLESDVDEQIIIVIPFNQVVKLHSFSIEAPLDKAPKTIRTYVNRAVTLSFDDVDSVTETEKIELTEESYKEGTIIPLRFVKYQSVHSITIFVEVSVLDPMLVLTCAKDNLTGADTSAITRLTLYGSPVEATKPITEGFNKDNHDHGAGPSSK